MSLRTRLIVAFLLLSVVPLAVVTAQHYWSSLDTLHRVAKRDAEQMTLELGQRMETVKGELSQRVEQLWAANQPAARETDARREVPVQASATALDDMAEALGDVALLLERIEFRADGAAPRNPALPPSPPAAPMPPPVGAAAVSNPAGSATAEPHAAPVVVNMANLRRQLEKKGIKVDEWTPEVERLVASGIGVGQAAATAGLRIGADVLGGLEENAPREPRAPTERATSESAARQNQDRAARAAHAAFADDGEHLQVMMQHDGKPVGRIDAKVRLRRVLSTVVSNTRRERGEIPFAVDPKGAVIAKSPADRAAIEALLLRKREPFTETPGWIVVMRDDPAGSGARFGIARRLGDSVRDLQIAAGRDLATGLGVISLALIGIFPISRGLTRNVSRLHDGVNEIARGNYAARVDVKSKDEVGQLAAAFNQMAADIEAHQKLAVDQESLKRELELCRQIQSDMLPREPFRATWADVRGISLPAREVGGDFFNYFTMEQDLAVLVGDVSGKGVSAALTMANVQATLKARLPLVPDLAALVGSIDVEFEKSTPRGVYATLFAAVLDRSTRTLRYVNAGHHPQFVLRQNSELTRLPSTGLPIGLLPGQGYVEQRIALAEGDLLFFYTDGAVETENEAGDMFGTERLEALLADVHNDGVDAVLERVEDAVRAFRGSAEPFDDATLMALRVGS